MNGSMSGISGIPLKLSEAIPEFVPVLQLSECVDVSGEFRFAFNNYLMSIFGARREIVRIAHPLIGGELLLMHPNTYHWLKERIGADL